jgi:hypothetical protein
MNYNKLKENYETLTNNGYYNKGAYAIANAIGLKMKILDCEYKEGHFNDNVWRYVFKIRLSKGGKRYTFEFGQSIMKGSEEPTLYDVLTCLQKYDVGTFEDFCDIFGYNLDSILERKKAKTIYKAVVKEFQAMERLFDSEELEVLQLIN